MPTPRLIASPVLDPKNIKAISLFHALPQTVRSYHVNQPTQARIIDPEPARSELNRFRKRKLRCNFGRNNLFSNFSLPLIFRAIFYYARGDTVDFDSFLLAGLYISKLDFIYWTISHMFRDLKKLVFNLIRL